MNVKTRQKIERRIVRRIVTDATKAGYNISVHDGESIALAHSVKVKAIMAACFSTDEDVLLLYRGNDTIAAAWVNLTYGNDGWDVISDYNLSIENLLEGAFEIANTAEETYA